MRGGQSPLCGEDLDERGDPKGPEVHTIQLKLLIFEGADPVPGSGVSWEGIEGQRAGEEFPAGAAVGVGKWRESRRALGLEAWTVLR